MNSDDAYSSSSFQYSDDDFDDELSILESEDEMDWYSEELLNLWMSIVEYHEDWYLPLKKTFHEFCVFVLSRDEEEDTIYTDEVQAIKDHPFIKDRNWELFFFSKL